MALPITATKTPRPPRMFVYGPPGIGKTTLAAQIPDVLLLPAEEGADALDVPRLPQPATWDEAMALLDQVAADPEGFKAFAVDSVSAMEALCQAHVAASYDGKSYRTVDDIPYGKGYPAVATEWRGFLDRLSRIRNRGLAIVLIGHLSIVKFEDPRTAGYERMQPRLHKSILPMTIEWCEAMFCATYRVYTDSEDKGFNRERVRGVGQGERILYTEERPAYLAKNRWSLPAEVPMGWGPIFTGIAAAYAPKTETAAVA